MIRHKAHQLDAAAHKVVLEHHGRPRWNRMQFQLGINRSGTLVDAEAKKLAASADVVVLAAGFDPGSESEGADRTFSLPPGQDELIQEIAAANKNTIGSYLFVLGDTREARGEAAEAFAFLNDRDREVGGDVIECRSPGCAAEVPDFIREIRRLFTAEEIRDYLDRLENTKYLAPPDPDLEMHELDDPDDEPRLESPVMGAEELLRFARVRQLLQS